MDDFIDDSDAKVDISAEIRNIFGYDKRRFKDEVICKINLLWTRGNHRGKHISPLVV